MSVFLNMSCYYSSIISNLFKTSKSVFDYFLFLEISIILFINLIYNFSLVNNGRVFFSFFKNRLLIKYLKQKHFFPSFLVIFLTFLFIWYVTQICKIFFALYYLIKNIIKALFYSMEDQLFKIFFK